jgi:hypothetical protein
MSRATRAAHAQKAVTMNTKILFRSSPLQQQPQRRVNQQQQQSSGSGEFQPARSRQVGQDGSTAAHGRPAPVSPSQVI